MSRSLRFARGRDGQVCLRIHPQARNALQGKNKVVSSSQVKAYKRGRVRTRDRIGAT